jgi:aspartyl-tRNA(Asn)/glutamyl-tRNA(Gln) amidotransferase subunit B
VKLCGRPKIVSNWVMGDLLRYLNEQKREIKESPVSPAHVAEMINLIENGTISGKIAKEVFEEMYKSSKMPAEIVREKGLTQITDEGAVVKAVEEAHGEEPTSRPSTGPARRIFPPSSWPGDEAHQGQGHPHSSTTAQKMLTGS